VERHDTYDPAYVNEGFANRLSDTSAALAHAWTHVPTGPIRTLDSTPTTRRRTTMRDEPQLPNPDTPAQRSLTTDVITGLATGLGIGAGTVAAEKLLDRPAPPEPIIDRDPGDEIVLPPAVEKPT
jgi:hypothetical protein